ncbi:DNA-binding transcriptional MerR regulator [Kitasatospora sp. MAA4]|uniref:MerR family transcriptional regulator n=1 Tax=Kitasatospora sp. MAA4 TaxID=3035093 RepID=UPI002473E637|nr:MerR family transcriptional regulator [Kitasatospora sp. MAA4]MDH6132417.1 DNA-binding transcriptional MerR regulator [Kitasatospora sp. MAA4]
MSTGIERSFTIGALAEAAGVSVKTVRHYSDGGLLPAPARSSGGHRRYGEAALETLLTIRRLRALGLPLPLAGAVVRAELSLEDALASQQDEVERQLTELRWRSAGLRALRLAAGDPAGLELLGEAMRHAPGRDAFADFWRRVLPLRMPAKLRSAIVDAALPELPDEPTARQALAYAQLHALTADRAEAAAVRGRSPMDCEDAPEFFHGLGEAYALAGAELARSAAPQPGQALDCFVAVHARAERSVDSADFRIALGQQLIATADPAMTRYWTLAGELTPEPTMGEAHVWLTEALGVWRRAA